MPTDQELYNELAYYTLAHPDPEFIHQYIVDAFTAQHADAHTKPIAITFALAGLYLCVEKNFSGKAVQHVHMQLAQRKQQWPSFAIPDYRGEITVADVVRAAPGDARDAKIHEWCDSVWGAWSGTRESIEMLLGSKK